MQTTITNHEPVSDDSRRMAVHVMPGGWRRWAWLALAVVLLLFSNGANSVPLAAWLSPVFLLRFVRTQRAAVGLPIAYLLLIATFSFQFRGMVPIPGAIYLIFLAFIGAVSVLPYLVDRGLVHRLNGLAATLVFPMSWAAVEYLNSLGPYGSWAAIAYSQYGSLPLLQILSVTGLWGLTFLIGWFASVCNWVWEEGLETKRVRSGSLLCLGAITLIVLLGGARMTLFPPSSQTVRVASLSRLKVSNELSDVVWKNMMHNRLSPEEVRQVRDWGKAVDDNLLARSEREAQAGARIVFWGEANAPVLKEDEAAFIAQGRELAARYRIYLGMSLAVWNAGQQRPLENKLVLIDPAGQVAWEYYKARPVPGSEAAISVIQDGKLRVSDTTYGRLSSIICFDGDFPQLLAQAGRLGADVVLDPSNDWQAIDPWHTQMASFRAIEQGFNLIRHTSHGLSAAFDYQGRRLAAMDHFSATDYVMISEIPSKGVRTLYGKLGDWFAWACLAGLLWLIGQATRTGRSMDPAA
ncbi:MAG TPA: nitrilase-related carbon-nitrogen hydrolase [Terriglobia bacterium]|nr:nitrilase-related carbon-nitrogen hydrolase [Terriglobia bacterium]